MAVNKIQQIGNVVRNSIESRDVHKSVYSGMTLKEVLENNFTKEQLIEFIRESAIVGCFDNKDDLFEDFCEEFGEFDEFNEETAVEEVVRRLFD